MAITATLSTLPDKLWTVREASEWLSMTQHAIRSMVKRQQFPVGVLLKLGRRIRFRSDLLRQWALQSKSA